MTGRKDYAVPVQVIRRMVATVRAKSPEEALEKVRTGHYRKLRPESAGDPGHFLTIGTPGEVDE
jgi:hypothetical protein